MKFKKIGKVFTSKSVGTGPSSYKKRTYRTAVSQRLRNTALGCHCLTEKLKNFAQDSIALSRLYILSRLCHYCPVTASSFWCKSIRFDCIANATDIQRFCKM